MIDIRKQFDPVTRLLLLMPPAMAAIVTFDQWFLWSTKEDYTFGYTVPFFAAYVVYDRWPQIAAHFETPGDPAARPAKKFWEFCFAGGAWFSLLCFLIGGVTRALGGANIIGNYLITFGFCGVTTGILWMISAKNLMGEVRSGAERWRFLRLFAFPVLVWIISGPFIYLVDTSVKILLLDKVTAVVTAAMQAMDYEVTRQANLILLPGGDQVGVADACSGIRSLTACVFMGAFISALFVDGPVRKLVMLALSGGFALLLNIMRNIFLTLWAYKHGSHALDCDFAGHGPKDPAFSLGTVHDLAGYAAMGVTFLLLAALIPVVNFRIKPPDTPPAGDDTPDAAQEPPAAN